MYSEEQYQEFSDKMETKYPKMFGQKKYGGFCVGPGWWPILEALCNQIHGYTEWKNNTRESLLKNNPHNQKIPDEVPQVIVDQVKEKFGGLRFYYQGGDDHISGMVRMAEMWAHTTCEECGIPGKPRTGGWIKTLCETHDAERKERYKKEYNE